LSATAATFAKSVEKLSSGLRINRAADDSAGLAISEKLKAQVTGLNQAQRNAQDGVSMVQTAEGALTEVHSMLQRIRELGVEAANSTLSSSDAASVSTEITSLRAEINRIAGATTFNGQYLLTGALSVAQSGGTLTVGKALNTGQTASLAAVDVSGAKASTTYTFTAQGNSVTLSDGTGLSQQVALTATIGATGTETINFGNMGVKLTVVGASNKTAANLATDLANATIATSQVAGNAGSDLVNLDVLSQTSATPVVAGGGVSYVFGGLDGSSPVTATASAGVAQGTLSLTVDSSGNITTNALGGETFTGNMDPIIADGRTSTVTLNGSRGNTVQLTYLQTTGTAMVWDSADMTGAAFSFVAGAGTAQVSGMAAPTAAAGTYSFTSSGAGSLTLSRNGGGATDTIAVTDMVGAGPRTLTFANTGISFTLTSDANGLTAAAAITNLLQPANDTIVITNAGNTPGTIATGAGTGANFQVGANAADSMGVTFADARMSNTAGYGTLDAKITAFETATGNGTGIVLAAQNLITAVDTAIGFVSKTRGDLGAVQNRLEHTTAAISVASENLNASESRIRDLDVASEMVNFTKTQILQQAGTAILAQANSAPQNILTLLR
jgi:flagellin